MNTPLTTTQRRDEIDAWFSLIARYILFFCGLLAFAFNLAFMGEQPTEFRVFAAASAIGMMGRVAYAGLVEILRASKGNGSNA